MKIVLLLVLNTILLYREIDSVSDKNNVDSVIFVNLLWRHGERNPVNFYANDRHQDESYWPEGIGQLTNAGKVQHYRRGQWLRRRYDGLLTDRYSPDRVYVRSTDFDRTIMSAQANLAGLYPPRGPQVWSKHLSWQPIPVHTTPEELDKVVAAKAPCPAYDAEFLRVSQSEEIRQVYRQYQDIVDAVRHNAATADDVIDFKYIHDTWDTLTIEKRRGFSLPKWAEDILPRMYKISIYRLTIETWTKKLGRLKTGLLIQEMVENMVNRTEGGDRALNVYSAHDVTVASLLNTLGVFDDVIPPYAACVMLELRRGERGQHYVTLFYSKSVDEDPHLLTIPGCSAFCPLDEFIALTKPLIPEDWDKECQQA